MRTALVSFLFLISFFGAPAQELAIVGVKVYSSPEAQPVSGATILIHAGKIAAVGKDVRIPKNVSSLSCDGCVVFAGFWNTHVHFMEPKWMDVSKQPAEQLTRQLREMLTLSGFTTVVDTASIPDNTVALRRRIESGEVMGPRIYTAGAGLFPPHSLLFYVKDMPPEVLAQLPQPDSPAEAVADVQKNIAAGADIVKLFTGSIVAPGHIGRMPL